MRTLSPGDDERFATLWEGLHPGQTGADAIDAQLHIERVDLATRTQLHHEASLDDLPDGAFVLEGHGPSLVLGAHLFRWTAAGYVEPRRRPRRRVSVVITPPSLVSGAAKGLAVPRASSAPIRGP